MMHRIEERLMALVRIGGLLILLLTAGCGWIHRTPQVDSPKPGAIQEKAPAPKPQQAVEKREEAVVAKPAQTAPKQDAPIAVKPAAPPVVPSVAPPVVPSAAPPVAPSVAPPVAPSVAPPVAPSVAPSIAPPVVPTASATNGNAVKPEAPVAKPAANVLPPPPASPPPAAPKKEIAAPPPPKPAAAPLDLASLEKRLKETNAIGVFTKLTLKNQVDDLLDQFRAYYQGRLKTTLAALRQPYDQLLLKVLSLLQDSDPSLARAITESREAIWGILSNPDKFKDL